ncbi:MAG: DUF4097 family beta strand repeat-containing protein [Acidobacteriota bacterium]
MKPITFFASVLVILLSAPAAWALSEKPPAQVFPIAANGRISVDNVNGNVTLEAWDRSEVSIEATKSGKTDAEIKGLEIHVEAKPDWIDIETRYPQSGWFGSSGGSVDYVIKMPAGLTVDTVQLVNGNLVMHGITGTTKAESVNGTITVADLSGDASLETVNGTIDAGFARIDRGQSLAFESVNGSINIHVPASADADVSVETVNGRVSQDLGLDEDKGQFVGSTVKGRLGSGGARLSIETVNGSVTLERQ